ncbi:hypothetical protein GCM10027098_38450 [Bowmanella dokdonensis]
MHRDMAYKLEQFDEDIQANQAFFSALEKLPVDKDEVWALLDEILEAVNAQDLSALTNRQDITVLCPMAPLARSQHMRGCIIKIHKMMVLFRLNPTVPVVSFRYQLP